MLKILHKILQFPYMLQSFYGSWWPKGRFHHKIWIPGPQFRVESSDSLSEISSGWVTRNVRSLKSINARPFISVYTCILENSMMSFILGYFRILVLFLVLNRPNSLISSLSYRKHLTKNVLNKNRTSRIEKSRFSLRLDDVCPKKYHGSPIKTV